MQRFLKLLILSPSLLLFGCTPQCIEVTSPQQIGQTNLSGDNTLKASQGEVEVTTIATRKRNDLIQAYIKLHNESSSSNTIKYQIKWMDANGFPVGQPGPWTPTGLYGNSNQVVSVIAPNKTATHFVMRVCKR